MLDGGRMQNFLKIAEGVDTLPLVLALQRQPELFGRNGERQYAAGTPHAGMTDIWVRYNDRTSFDAAGSLAGINDEHDSVWYPEADFIPEARPIIFGLMARVQGERLGGVLITKLPPGAEIAPHIDLGWHAGYYDKYIVALQNLPGAVFGFPEGEFEARTGDVHWFRNSVPHYVKNSSKDERLAMIVCVRHSKGSL